MTELKLDTPLTIDQVEFRTQSINKGGYMRVLAYKTARIDYHRLNEVYGAGNWQRKHEEILGRLYCSIGLWHEPSKSWAWVQDVGTESSAEKEKGQASDSFKRAGFNLGIGSELYEYPKIDIKLNQDEWEIINFKGKDKAVAKWNLKLMEWVWFSHFEENVLTYLAAKDWNNNLRFEWGVRPKVEK